MSKRLLVVIIIAVAAVAALVGFFILRHMWQGYEGKKADQKGTVGSSAQSPLTDPRGIVDIRAAPGVARVTL